MSKSQLSSLKPRKSAASELALHAGEQWEKGKLRSAFRLFLAAAKAGDSGAQTNIGYFYNVGVGVQPNRAAALYWYKRAWRHKNKYAAKYAASNIGTIWRDEQKLKRAVSWFQRAVKLGCGDANLEIAKIYFRNERDKEKAIRYLREAIRAAHITDGSKEQARRLLRQALRKGSAVRWKR